MKEQYGAWQPHTQKPEYQGYYDVRFDDTIHRWQWLLGHWYDKQGRIRREPVEFRGSAVPLHRDWCLAAKPASEPSGPCNCFLSKVA